MADRHWVTALFVPADRPERIGKALAAGADLAIIDLEDAVSPERKVAARQAIVGLGIDWSRVAIRVNAAGTPWHADDLDALRGLPIAALMLPKADIRDVAAAAALGLPLLPLVETARGLTQARVLAQAPGVVALAFGSIDYCHDIGCAHEPDALLLPRSELVLASRLGGLVPPLDGVTTRFDDPALVEADARRARGLGFGGKLLIHPGQISPARVGFLPDEAELAWARSVVGAAPGEGAGAVGGEMVDRPVLLRAQMLLARARTSRD